VRIHLTARARALEPTLAAAVRGLNARAIDGLTLDEAEHLMRTVTRVIANLGGRDREADAARPAPRGRNV
jgi:DNA-binding MarR family transcriptional regulator